MKYIDETGHVARVLNALKTTVKEEQTEGEVAVAYSGGIDSSIVAYLLGEHAEPNLYTVGLEGSYDLTVGEETADYLGLPWEGIVIDEDDVISTILEICRIIPTRNPTTISFEMPLFLVVSRVRERHVYSGQGADELFAGYARYVGMSENELGKSVSDDLARLLDTGLEYERNIALNRFKELHYPYLHQRVIDEVRSIPVIEEFRGKERKATLRDVARLLDMGEIADREKKAAQYGSGIMRCIRQVAKRNGMTVREFVRTLTLQGEMP